MSKTEASIHKLEREIKEIDVELSINYEETISRPDFFDNYQQLKKKLEKLMEQWEEITARLEADQ